MWPKSQDDIGIEGIDDKITGWPDQAYNGSVVALPYNEVVVLQPIYGDSVNGTRRDRSKMVEAMEGCGATASKHCAPT